MKSTVARLCLVTLLSTPSTRAADDSEALSFQEALRRVDQNDPEIQSARGRLASVRGQADAPTQAIETSEALLEQIRTDAAAKTRVALNRVLGARAVTVTADRASEVLRSVEKAISRDRADTDVRMAHVKTIAVRLGQLRADAARRSWDASNELRWHAGLSPATPLLLRGTLAEGVPPGDPDVEGLVARAMKDRGELRAARAAYDAALAPTDHDSETRVRELQHAIEDTSQAVRIEVVRAAGRFVTARRALAACEIDATWRAEQWKRIGTAASEHHMSAAEAILAMRDALELELQCIADGVELASADAELRRASAMRD